MSEQHEYPALHEVSHIETPEQIALQFRLAGVASRAFAYIIDFFVQLVPIIVALVAAVMLASNFLVSKAYTVESRGQFGLSLLGKAIAALVLFAVNFGYFFIFEILWRGQTPGKRAMGLRVMRDGGYPVDPRAALVRNLLRAIDFLPTFYLLGMGMVFWGRAGKRLGDYAAGTMVIQEMPAPRHEDATHRTASTLAHGYPSAPAISPVRLLASERDLVLQLFARSDSLTLEASAKLAGVLAAKIATRMGRTPPEPDDAEAFLRELLRHAHV